MKSIYIKGLATLGILGILLIIFFPKKLSLQVKSEKLDTQCTVHTYLTDEDINIELSNAEPIHIVLDYLNNCRVYRTVNRAESPTRYSTKCIDIYISDNATKTWTHLGFNNRYISVKEGNKPYKRYRFVKDIDLEYIEEVISNGD